MEPALHEGLLRLRDRVRGDSESVASVRRLFSLKNTMGYGLNSFLDHDEPVAILEHLMVGSEGTLGFIGSATFRTVPVRPQVATGLLVFDTVGVATGAVPQIVEAGAVTAELLDAASLRVSSLAPGAPAQITGLQVEQHAALLVEWHADTAEELAGITGPAQQVLDALRSYAADAGIDEIQWQTPDWNHDATRFYQRLGAQSLAKLRFTCRLPTSRLSAACPAGSMHQPVRQ